MKILSYIHIDIESSFAMWVGTILRDVETKILFVIYPGREEEVLDRLARVGFDQVIGFLDGDFESWLKAGKAVDTITSVTTDEVGALGNINYLDVGRESEYYSEHIDDAINAPLAYHWDSMAKVDKSKTYHVYCRSGNRSVIYASILKSKGFDNLIDIAGGIEEIKKSEKFKITDYVCPTTML
jgi:rhodanese-related sulfurtransferase